MNSGPLADGLANDEDAKQEWRATEQGQRETAAIEAMTDAQREMSDARADELNAGRMALARAAADEIARGMDGSGIAEVIEKVNDGSLFSIIEDIKRVAHEVWAEAKGAAWADAALAKGLNVGIVSIFEALRKMGLLDEGENQAARPSNIERHGSSHLSFTDLVARSLTDIQDGHGRELTVSGKREAKRITRLALSFDGIDGINRLSRRDRDLTQDIASYWDGSKRRDPGYCDIIDYDLWRFHTGQTRRPSQDELDELDRSMTLQGITRGIIDASDTAKMLGGKSLTFDEPLINFARVTAVNQNGTVSRAYRILSEPLISKHNRETARSESGRQLTAYPHSLLEACAAVRNSSAANDSIRSYLLERVAQMKGRKNAPRRILLDTLMGEAGMDVNDKKARQKARATARIFLETFVEQKWIKGFEDVTNTNRSTNRRQFAGFDIKL